MTFDFNKTKIAKAVDASANFSPGLLKVLKMTFLIFGVSSLLLYWLSLLGSEGLLVLGFAGSVWQGFADVFIVLGLSVLFYEIYFKYYLKEPPIGESENLADFLDFDSASVVSRAMKFSRSAGESVVSGRSLLWALMANRIGQMMFLRLGIAVSDFERELLSIDGTGADELTVVVDDADKLRIKQKAGKISIADILASLFDHDQFFKQAVLKRDLGKNDLENLATWYEEVVAYSERHKKFWSLENRLRKPPIGVSWVYGFSNLLNKFVIDLTAASYGNGLGGELIGRKAIVQQIEEILSRAGENNVLLVGEAGVGKKTIIAEFARLITVGKALPQLNYKRVLELNVSLLTSSSKEKSDIENTLIAILNESIQAGNVILVLHDLQNFTGNGEGLGKIDLSALLLPYLESNRLQVISTTDPISFHKLLESRADIMKVFERIEVSEPNTVETLLILESLLPAFEAQHGVFVLYSALKKIVDDADRFLKSAPFPEKALDLMSEVLAHAKSKQVKIITGQDVDNVITRKTNIPLGQIGTDERAKLINLDTEMHKDIVGQNEAVKVVVRTMQRLRAGLVKRQKPAGVFLFVGPTGVGKTQTAKALARTYFGAESKMIRFDMSEYQDSESLDRFLGSLRINEPGQLVSAVRDNPFSLILLDEIEKAHRNILNIFLQVFDEGRVTDVFGRKVSFEENIFIATSNAAADFIRDLVKQGIDPSTQKEKVIDALIKGGYFSPEFLNRFDEVVIYHPLTEEQLAQIALMLVSALQSHMKEQGYVINIPQDVVGYIAKAGFDPQFGARPMQRVIQDKLESVIARKILEGLVQKGVEFSLSLEDL